MSDGKIFVEKQRNSDEKSKKRDEISHIFFLFVGCGGLPDSLSKDIHKFIAKRTGHNNCNMSK